MCKDGGIFSYNNFIQAVSGATGSVTAQLLTMPLTTSFTRAQLEDGERGHSGPLGTIIRIFKEEGIQGVYKGGSSTCFCIAVSNFVYFYSFHALKTTRKKDQSPLSDLFFACVAGCLNVLITNPLWVVNSRLRMAGVNEDSVSYRGQLDGLVRIFKEEGIPALWNGTKASLMLVSNPALKFTAYEFFKRRLIGVGSGQLTAKRAFAIGALATAVATIITYPLQMVQAKSRNSKEQLALSEFAVQILRKNGIAGFFHGLDSKLLQAMLASGFMFLAYEKIATFVFRILTFYQAKKL